MKFNCTKCSLSKHNCCLTGEGPKDAKLFILGQSPGPKERELEQLFVGPSGKRVDEALLFANIKRKDIYITNAVKGYQVPGKIVTKTAVRICAREYLDKEIAEVQPHVILCLGSTASAALGYRLIANSHFYDNTYKCFIVLTHHPARLLRTNADRIHKEFREAFVLAKTLLNKCQINKARASVEILENLTTEKLNKLGNPIALDLETTGLNFLKDQIVSVGLSDGKTTYGIPIYNNLDKLVFLNKVRDWIATKDIILHHGKFDFKFLKKAGVPIRPYFDTMLAHFLIDKDAPHRLADIALKYLHTNLTKGTIDFEKDFREDTIDPIKYSKYAANDAWMTYRIYEIFKDIIDKQYNKPFYKIMMPTLEWLANAEYKGIKVDRAYLSQSLVKAQKELGKINKNIQEDKIVKDFCKIQNLPELNLRSPKQLSTLLYQYLKIQNRIKKTGEAILEELTIKYPSYIFLKEIVNYRHLYKSYKTYLQNLLSFSELDEKVHCNYNQCRVASGRLSCSSPNLQNIPKGNSENKIKKEQANIIRKSFIASKGYTLLEGDFKQAEFRMLANYSRDPHMIALINQGKDIHNIIASVIYLKPESEITEVERNITKTVNFGLMYGRGIKSISDQLKITFKEAENIRETFLGTFKQAAVWVENVQKFAKQNGYVKTLTGRKVDLPLIYSKDKEKMAYALRLAVNTPVQGAVGDLTNLAGVLLFQRFKKENLDAYVIMNIHDSLIIECRTDLVDTIECIMKDIMENKVKEELGLRINLTIDIHKGSNLAFK